MKNLKIFRVAIIICIVLALSAAAVVCFAMQKDKNVNSDKNYETSAYTDDCCM